MQQRLACLKNKKYKNHLLFGVSVFLLQMFTILLKWYNIAIRGGLTLNYIIGFICFLLLMLLFSRLIQQSKKPSGFLGKRMMKLWNRAYLPMFVWAIRHLDRTFYPVILDVGVGNGRSTILLKETFPQSTITGIDISDTAIAQAKHIEMTNLNFERRDVSETGFSDESVDLITAFQTHFHWRDLEASFMELRRILKSDGMLLLACEYNKLSYFLPEVQSEEAFRRFLLSVGFELVTSQRKRSWILYKIVKN